MRTFVYLFIALLVLGSCNTIKKAEYVETPVILEKVVYRDRTDVRFDSVYVHDSIMIHQKADTVLIRELHTKYIERATHDTIVHVDSIPVPYEVEIIKETVKKERPPFSAWAFYGFAMVVFWEVVRRKLLKKSE